MRRDTSDEEQVRQHIDDIGALELAGDADREAFPRELVDDIEHPERSAIMRAVVYEVVRPDVVRPFGAQPNARAVIQPKPFALRLFGGNLQPFTLPDSLNTLVVHRPSGAAQKFCDPAVAIATVVAGERDDVGSQPFFISPAAWLLALR